MHAAFSLDIDVLGNTEQSLVRSYWRPFKAGERAPFYQKLLQICPAPLQHGAALIVSKGLRINVSRMRSLVKETLLKRLEAIRGEKSQLYLPTEEERPQDILDALLRRGYTHLSERALLRHAMTTMAASLEMVSNQLSWAIYALSHPKNLHVQEELRNKIRTRFPCSPDRVTWEDINSLPYLIGVINEVLRLYPNVSHRGRVCNTATSLIGIPIRKGTILTWPVYAMNRHVEHWGADANVFRPERWISGIPDEHSSQCRDAFAFMTFGQGPRKCPGEHYTRAVLGCMLLGLIGRFEFRKAEGHADVVDDDSAKRVGFGIVMKAEIWAEVREISG
jgi:cytochrome P450